MNFRNRPRNGRKSSQTKNARRGRRRKNQPNKTVLVVEKSKEHNIPSNMQNLMPSPHYPMDLKGYNINIGSGDLEMASETVTIRMKNLNRQVSFLEVVKRLPPKYFVSFARFYCNKMVYNKSATCSYYLSEPHRWTGYMSPQRNWWNVLRAINHVKVINDYVTWDYGIPSRGPNGLEPLLNSKATGQYDIIKTMPNKDAQQAEGEFFRPDDFDVKEQLILEEKAVRGDPQNTLSFDKGSVVTSGFGFPLTVTGDVDLTFTITVTFPRFSEFQMYGAVSGCPSLEMFALTHQLRQPPAGRIAVWSFIPNTRYLTIWDAHNCYWDVIEATADKRQPFRPLPLALVEREPKDRPGIERVSSGRSRHHPERGKLSAAYNCITYVVFNRPVRVLLCKKEVREDNFDKFVIMESDTYCPNAIPSPDSRSQFVAKSDPFMSRRKRNRMMHAINGNSFDSSLIFPLNVPTLERPQPVVINNTITADVKEDLPVPVGDVEAALKAGQDFNKTIIELKDVIIDLESRLEVGAREHKTEMEEVQSKLEKLEDNTPQNVLQRNIDTSIEKDCKLLVYPHIMFPMKLPLFYLNGNTFVIFGKPPGSNSWKEESLVHYSCPHENCPFESDWVNDSVGVIDGMRDAEFNVRSLANNYYGILIVLRIPPCFDYERHYKGLGQVTEFPQLYSAGKRRMTGIRSVRSRLTKYDSLDFVFMNQRYVCTENFDDSHIMTERHQWSPHPLST
jgi:hypothetical protein